MSWLNLIISVFLMVLSADLLYLNFIGVWYDTLYIETAEIICLFILGMLGVVGTALNMRKIWRTR